MAEKVVEATKGLSIMMKLAKMRVELQNTKIEKTGRNTYSNFMYYQLEDFLPQCNRIALENKVLCYYEIEDKEARLTLFNCEEPGDMIIFKIPVAEAQIKGASSIQNIGGTVTYTRRYLYMVAFEISENDDVDSQTPVTKPEPREEEFLDETIPEKTAMVLGQMLMQRGIAQQRIFTKYGVQSLKDLKASQYREIMLALDGMEKPKNVDLGL